MSAKPSLGILKDLIPPIKPAKKSVAKSKPKKTQEQTIKPKVQQTAQLKQAPPVPVPVQAPPVPVPVPVPVQVQEQNQLPIVPPPPAKKAPGPATATATATSLAKAPAPGPASGSASGIVSKVPVLNASSVNVNLVSTPSNAPTPKEIKSRSSSRKSEKKTKIGSYASAEFQNWLNTPIQKPKIKRSKKTNDDAFQIFQDFSDMVDHAEWKAFFQKLYTGKFPHGYSYRNQTLFFRKRTKIEKLEVLDSTKSTLAKAMQFFITYGGYSNDEDDINIYDFMVSQTPQFTTWKDIRSKKTKQFFIQKYIEELAANYELNDKERRILIDNVHTGFLLKTIDSTDIEFEDKKIVNIKSLHWNEEIREFEIPRSLKICKSTRKNPSEKVQRNTFSSHWTKFVNNILKNKSSTQDEISTDVSTNQDDLTDNITDTTVSMSVVSEF